MDGVYHTRQALSDAMDAAGFTETSTFGASGQAFIAANAAGERISVSAYYKGSAERPLASELPRAFQHCEWRVSTITAAAETRKSSS